MEFEVASVKRNKSGGARYSTIPLGGRSTTYSPTGGLFSATNYPLINYMAFAYKFSSQQVPFQMSGLPNWATDRSVAFDIETRAQENPTKDQFRLMMQALLADRFKLAMHHETRQMPVCGHSYC